PMAFGPSLSREQTSGVTPAVRDVRETQLLHGSVVGNTLVGACGNCHSKQTNLPWYAHVVPISWWMQSHVHEGTQGLDFQSGGPIRHTIAMNWNPSTASFRMAGCRPVCTRPCTLKQDGALSKESRYVDRRLTKSTTRNSLRRIRLKIQLVLVKQRASL